MQNKEADFGDMSTLSSLTNSAVNKGYTENFIVNEEGLFAPAVDKHFLPGQTKIDNFYRFEGASDPQDNAILYLLKTDDGTKGMLIDAYGADANDLITDFIKQVEEMHKTEAEQR
jgi:hypothetical protein